MDKFVIRGGNPLVGTIRVSGAKNSALPCMAAAILTEEEVTLENIPQVRDIATERKLLASMGATVEAGSGANHHRITISCRTLSDPVAKYEIVKTMRASSLVLGPLVARTGMARVAMPGGCAIGITGGQERSRDERAADHDLPARAGNGILKGSPAQVEDRHIHFFFRKEKYMPTPMEIMMNQMM